MPTFNSDIYPTQIAPAIGDRLAPTKVLGRLLFATPKYTMAGTEAAADVVNLCVLPKGAIIDPTQCYVVGDGIATTATLDVGDDDTAGVGAAADADRYADGLDVAAAGIDQFSSIACAARLTPYALGAESIIKATFATMNTPVAGKILQFRIGYFLPA